MTAKKEAKKRRLAAKRRRQAQGPAGQPKLMRRVERSPLFADAELRIEPPGQRKMSKVILEFAEPLLHEAEGDREYSGALALAITAWNASQLPGRTWKETLPEHLQAMAPGEDFTDELEHLFTELVQRRRRLHPHVERLVLDYELTRSRSSRRLNVVSTLASTRQEGVGAV